MKAAPLSKDLERVLLSAPHLEPILTSYLLTQSRALNCLNNIMLIFDSQGMYIDLSKSILKDHGFKSDLK
jgi:hypothetical protein